MTTAIKEMPIDEAKLSRMAKSGSQHIKFIDHQKEQIF